MFVDVNFREEGVVGNVREELSIYDWRGRGNINELLDDVGCFVGGCEEEVAMGKHC